MSKWTKNTLKSSYFERLNCHFQVKFFTHKEPSWDPMCPISQGSNVKSCHGNWHFTTYMISITKAISIRFLNYLRVRSSLITTVLIIFSRLVLCIKVHCLRCSKSRIKDEMTSLWFWYSLLPQAGSHNRKSTLLGFFLFFLDEACGVSSGNFVIKTFR